MVRLFAAAVFLCLLFGPALAAGLDAAAINNAEYPRQAPAEDKVDPAVVKVQIFSIGRCFLRGRSTASSPKIPKRPCGPSRTRKA